MKKKTRTLKIKRSSHTLLLYWSFIGQQYLGIFPAPVRYIVESLQKYEHYQMDFTAVSFFTAFAAAMGNTWLACFMTGWVSRPILYVVLVGPRPAAARHHRCVRR